MSEETSTDSIPEQDPEFIFPMFSYDGGTWMVSHDFKAKYGADHPTESLRETFHPSVDLSLVIDDVSTTTNNIGFDEGALVVAPADSMIIYATNPAEGAQTDFEENVGAMVILRVAVPNHSDLTNNGDLADFDGVQYVDVRFMHGDISSVPAFLHENIGGMINIGQPLFTLTGIVGGTHVDISVASVRADGSSQFTENPNFWVSDLESIDKSGLINPNEIFTANLPGPESLAIYKEETNGVAIPLTYNYSEEGLNHPEVNELQSYINEVESHPLSIISINGVLDETMTLVANTQESVDLGMSGQLSTYAGAPEEISVSTAGVGH